MGVVKELKVLALEGQHGVVHAMAKKINSSLCPDCPLNTIDFDSSKLEHPKSMILLARKYIENNEFTFVCLRLGFGVPIGVLKVLYNLGRINDAEIREKALCLDGSKLQSLSSE